MYEIEEKSNVGFRFVGGDFRQIQMIYSQLKANIQDNDLFELFAQPTRIRPKSIVWKSSVNAEYIRFDRLTRQQQDLAINILSEQTSRMLKKINSYGDAVLMKKFTSYIEIPDKETDLFLSPESNKVLITRWGFIDSSVNVGEGNLSGTVNLPYYPVRITLKYEDGDVATDISIEYKNSTKPGNIKTDANGIAQLPEARNESVYEIKIKTPLEEVRETCNVYKGASYDFIIKRPLDIEIIFLDASTKEIIIGEEFFILLKDNLQNMVTDGQGKVLMDNLKMKDKVLLKSENYELSHSELVCFQHHQVFQVLVTPKKKDLFKKRILLKDKKGNPLANYKAKIICKGNERIFTKEYEPVDSVLTCTTDANGMIELLSNAPIASWDFELHSQTFSRFFEYIIKKEYLNENT